MGFSFGTSNLSPSDTTHAYLPFYCHCHCHRHRHHHRRRRQLALRLLTNFCYQSRQSLHSALGIWIQEPSASRIPSKGLRLNPHPHLRLRLPVDVDTDGIVVVVVVVTSHFPTEMVSLSLTPFHLPSPSLPFHPSIHPPNPSIRPSGHPSNQFIHDARAQEPVTRDTARVSKELAAAPVFHRLSAVSDASVQPAPQQQHLHQSRTLAVYHHQHSISVQHSS